MPKTDDGAQAGFTEASLTKAVDDKPAEPSVADLVKAQVADAVKAAIPEIIKGVVEATAPPQAPIPDAAEDEPAKPAFLPADQWEGDKLLIGPVTLPDAAAGALYTAKLDANKEGAVFRAQTLFDAVKLAANGEIRGQCGPTPGVRHFEVKATFEKQVRWHSFRIHAR